MHYTNQFFDVRSEKAQRSAAEVVPILLELFRPKTVVDVGCGQGEWLDLFRKHGVTDVLGIDGSYVDTRSLKIPDECFLPSDLCNLKTVKRQFDIAICLEVAEHLPESVANGFVRFLTTIAPIIVFSAAVPHQPGIGHINCKWPPFWFKQFEQHGYVATDPLRRRLWQNPNVASWYQQNMFVLATPHAIANNDFLRDEAVAPFDYPTLIDPTFLWRAEPTVARAFLELKRAIIRSVRRRTGKLLSRILP